MAGVLLIIFVCLVLLLISMAWGILDKDELAAEEFRRKVDAQVRFENKLDKLLKKVTNMEWTFYRKVFNKIKYTDCSKWQIKKDSDKNHPLEPGDIYEIQIGYQLCIKTSKTEDKNGRLSYECTGLEILDGSGKCEVAIIPPKEQLEIYDLFVNYALYRLDLYQQKLDADERKKISEEHQNLIKEANNKFIL
jgi:hypothetical protein